MDFRINDTLHLKAEVLTEQQYMLEKNRRGLQQYELLFRLLGPTWDVNGTGINQEEQGILESINTKLNYLIATQAFQNTDCSDMEEQLVDISASGMRLAVRGACQVDDMLKITLRLSECPPLLLELLAKVVYVRDTKADSRRVGVRFVFRSEMEEHALIAYVYRRHREMIRLGHHSLLPDSWEPIRRENGDQS